MRWHPEKGITRVAGDCEGLLGVDGKKLTRSSEPLGLLPPELTSVLAAGLPDVPVFIATPSMTGSAFTMEDSVEVVLFGVPGHGAGSGVMLDELGAGIVGVDRNGTITIWNTAMSSMFRVSRQYAMGKHIQDVLVSPILYSWENVIRMVLEGKQVKVVCQPDPQRRIEGTFTLGGSGVMGTCFDTTENFQAENRLRISRKMNQAYFHSVSTGLVLFDRDYRILVANRAFGKIFGLVENLLGIHLYEILPGESYGILEDLARPLFDGSTTEQGEGRTAHFRLPGRGDRIVHQSVQPIVEDSGEVFYAVGIFEDVSEIDWLRQSYGGYVEAVRRFNVLSSFLLGKRTTGGGDVLANRVKDCLSATAVALYLVDPGLEIRLSGRSDGWPDEVPAKFSELRLPVTVDSETGCRLVGEDRGILSDHFSSCLVFHLAAEGKSYGYMMVGYGEAEPEADIFPLALLASSMVVFGFMRGELEAEAEYLDLLGLRQNELMSRFVEMLDVPVAMFRMDWSVIFWNPAMEELTGIRENLATESPELVSEILFGGIGGTDRIRKLLRSDASTVKDSWEVTGSGGKTRRCIWSMLRTEWVEGRNLEPVIVIAGVESGDEYSIKAAGKALETYLLISRGLVGILSVTNPAKVAEIAASTMLEISGASRVSVEIRGIQQVTRTTTGEPGSGGGRSQWSIPFVTDTDTLGECSFEGGEEKPILRDFARVVARTCVDLEKSEIGRRFAFLAERNSGKFFITSPAGRVLLSTWRDAQAGIVSRRTVYGMFPGTPRSKMDDVISLVRKKGRLDTFLRTRSGKDVEIAVTALDGNSSGTLLLWWPVDDPAYRMRRFLVRKGEGLKRIMSESLDGLLVSIDRSFSRLKEVLSPEHPAVSILNTSAYAFRGMRKDCEYIGLLHSVMNLVPSRLDAERMLDGVAAVFIEEGREPPETGISGRVCDLMGNGDFLVRIVSRLCMVMCGESVPGLGVSLVLRDEPELPDDVLEGTEHFVRIRIRRIDGRKLHGIVSDICNADLADKLKGGIDQEAEVGLLCLLLRMLGGYLLPRGENTADLFLPCAD